MHGRVVFQNVPSASSTSAFESDNGFQSSLPDVTRRHVCVTYLVNDDFVPSKSLPSTALPLFIIHRMPGSFLASSCVTCLTHVSNSFSPHPSGYATSRSSLSIVSLKSFARMMCDNHTGPVIAFAMHRLPKSMFCRYPSEEVSLNKLRNTLAPGVSAPNIPALKNLESPGSATMNTSLFARNVL